MSNVFSRSAVIAAALLSLSAVPALAQAPPAEGVLRDGIRSAVEVKAMDLDVVATTKDGQPVSDLTKSDFVVKVDGKPVPIDYFARIEAGALHGPDLQTASPDLVLETTATDKGDRFLPRQFLLFFDDEHLTPFERNKVIDSFRDFIARLTPSDKVSILSYGASNRIVVPFTSSKEDLLDALGKLEKIAPGGLRWEQDFKRTTFDVQGAGRRSRGALIRSFSQQEYVREKATLEDMRRAVAALAARQGKRVLVIVSNGLELHPGQILQQTLGPSVLSQWEYSVVDDVREVVSEANRAGITIHALDAKGLVTEADASQSGPSPFSSFFVNQTLREPLAEVTSQTGGTLLTNRNTFQQAMDRIYRDATSYYSVGVTLASVDTAKAKEHKVEVTTTRPGIVVRARRTYAPKTADESTRDRTEMALLNPGAKGDFPVAVALGPAKKGGGIGHRLAPFEVRVPASALTFEEKDGKKTAFVDVAIAAIQDNGTRSSVVPRRNTIQIPSADWEKAKGGVVKCDAGELKTGTGNYRFVATVRDVSTDRVGFGSSAVRIE